MATLSPTQEVDDPICACQMGNVFLNRLPLSAPPFQCSVNGMSTGSLPTDLIYRLDNTLPGTTSRLTLTPPGHREITLIEDLDAFTQSRPEEVGVFVGPVTDAPPAPSAVMGPRESRVDRARRLLNTYQFPSPLTTRGEIDRMQGLIDAGMADNDTEQALDAVLRDVEEYAYAEGYLDPPTGEEDLYLIEIPGWLQPYISEGEFDFNALTEEQLRPFAVAVSNGIGLVDEAILARDLSDVTGGAVDFTIGGTNTVPLALELGDMLRRRENRAFLAEVVRMGSNGRIGKVWRNSNGTLLLSFRGYAGVRQFLTGTVYAVSNSKVTVISSAVQNSRSWAGPLRSVGGRIPVISYVIVGALDVAEWMAQPAAERELSDLVGILIVDISKVAIATIAAAGVGAFLIASAAALPIIAVVAAGIAAGVVVGIGLDWLDSKFDITGKVKAMAGEAQMGIERFMETREDRAAVSTPAQIPVGRASSARLPGQQGLIPAGSETNALDALSEQNRMSSGF